MNILWVVGSLEQMGGGERLLLEGVKFYQNAGNIVKVVTWKYNKKMLFQDNYYLKDIEVLYKSQNINRNKLAKFGFFRIKSLFKLINISKTFNPDIIICQSEYDAIIVGIISKIQKKKFVVLIFGQTYQFPFDNIKYSHLFKKHLVEIVNSRQGYKNTIPLKPPRMNFLDFTLNNIMAYLRYYFIRQAYKTFTLSKQVQWEVEKIYKIKPQILRAGFRREKLKFLKNYFNKPKLKKDRINFLMVNRLEKKKNVDICINAFKDLPNNYFLTIVGTGNEFHTLKNMINTYKITERIKLTGRVSDKELEMYYRNSDVFISLDVGDFDITVVEAMLTGLYILVSTDFVIDEDFLEYNAIKSVNPNIESVKESLEKIRIIFGNNYPNINALYKFTWENYFSSIIKNDN